MQTQYLESYDGQIPKKLYLLYHSITGELYLMDTDRIRIQQMERVISNKTGIKFIHRYTTDPRRINELLY